MQRQVQEMERSLSQFQESLRKEVQETASSLLSSVATEVKAAIRDAIGFKKEPTEDECPSSPETSVEEFSRRFFRCGKTIRKAQLPKRCNQRVIAFTDVLNDQSRDEPRRSERLRKKDDDQIVEIALG